MRNKKVTVVLTTIAAMSIIVYGCGNDENKENNELNSVMNEFLQNETNEKSSTYYEEDDVLSYVEKSQYSKDIQALDSIKTAVSVYVATPETVYEDKKVYTLKELMDLDKDNIIAPILEDVFIENYENGEVVLELDASSGVFEGITADDVKVVITNGAIAIMAPVNEGLEDKYDAYTAGVHEWSEDEMVK